MESNDHDNLVRLTAAVEAMVKQMESLAKSFEADVEKLTQSIDKYRPMEIQIARDADSIATLNERIGKLERMFTGSLAALGIELLAIIGMVIVWFLTGQTNGQ